MSPEPSVRVFDADGVGVVVADTGATPQVLHWGASVADGHDLIIAARDGVAQSGLDEWQPVGLWRENARGFMGRPAIEFHRESGSWSARLELQRLDHDGSRLTTTSVDLDAGIEATATLELTAQGVLLITMSVLNTGTDALHLDALTTWLPLPDHASDVLDFSGRWLKERQPQRRPIGFGLTEREEREGRTGHGSTIVQLAMTATADHQHGSVWALGVAWSGNSRHAVERLASGDTSIGAGELLLPGEVVLAPGESHTAPPVIAVYSDQGIDGISDRLHRWLRARPHHPRTPRPLTLNVWEAVYFDHDIARLEALVDAAAEVGVERFVLDDGWFHARRDDHAGLGDWVVDRTVWPNGLAPFAERVRSRGMQFGLWFEGEMLSPDSDLFRAHPDWVLGAPGRMPPEARFQQVLDLTNEGAYSHVLGQVDAVLAETGATYIKWDHNRPLIEPTSHGRAAVRRQTEAIYRLFDELKARHPGLEIESCASGGGRIDLGMIEHVDRFWTSDSTDAIERLSIQAHTMVAIPPELLGSHIGPARNPSTGRRHGLAFRATIALFGHAGIEWDLTSVSAEELSQIADWAAYYREHRQLLHTGRVIRVPGPDSAAYTIGVVAQDRGAAIVGYVQLSTSPAVKPPRVRVPGLDRQSTYRVIPESPAGRPGSVQLAPPPWMSAGLQISGAWLEDVGLRPPTLHPESALIVRFERV